MRTTILFVLFLGLFASVLAHQACSDLLSSSPSSFSDGSEHSDCDYVTPDQTPASDADHQIDLYWVGVVHQYALDNMPTYPYGAALVDNRTNTLVAIGTNMFNSADPWYSQISVSHAETVVIANATLNVYPGSFNATTGKRKVDANWKYLTLYGNVEACPMCAQAAIWRGLRRMVFGARQNQLYAQRCWTEPTLSAFEVVDHSASFAPFSVVRGPMVELETTILQAFTNQCKSTTSTTSTSSSTTGATDAPTDAPTASPSTGGVRSSHAMPIA